MASAGARTIMVRSVRGTIMVLLSQHVEILARRLAAVRSVSFAGAIKQASQQNNRDRIPPACTPRHCSPKVITPGKKSFNEITEETANARIRDMRSARAVADKLIR